MTSPLRIGLAGLGTVGAGVAKILAAHGDEISRRAGRELRVVAVSARNRARDRGVDLSGMAWEDDPVALARREDVDVLVEVIGGSDGPAKAASEAALSRGAAVVTANKALMAHHGVGLAALAESAGAELRFEAAVAGGIPVLKALTEGLAANRIERLYGVLNGTCNYILTEMERTGRDYAEVLAEAQAKGYAEADPSFDVGGIDAGHKLALLAAIAFGVKPEFDRLDVEGIERITLSDLRRAREMGYAVKLLGVARRAGERIERAVRPCLVPADSAVGMLDGVTNAVGIEGDFVGATLYEGPGAGEGPTASAILADVIDIARGGRRPAFGVPAAALTDIRANGASAPAEHYLRIRLVDRPGALAEVARALGASSVSIREMVQHDQEGDASGADVLIVTHASDRVSLDRALDAIAELSVCLAPPMALRIEPM